MNNQETVLTFAQGSLIAKNELVFELSLADQASYFIYCESAEAAERFAFQAKQLVETLAPSGCELVGLLRQGKSSWLGLSLHGRPIVRRP